MANTTKKKRLTKKQREAKEIKRKKKNKKDTLMIIGGFLLTFCVVFTLIHGIGLIINLASDSGDQEQELDTQTWSTTVTFGNVIILGPAFDANEYSYNETYKGTTIYSTNLSYIKEIERYLDFVKEDLDKANMTIPMITYKDDKSCDGKINGFDNTIQITSCEGKQIRNTYIDNETWLPYVLYHEIGHPMTQSGNQCKADAYAQKIIERTGIKINITDKNCIQEGMEVTLPTNQTDNTTYRVGQEQNGKVEVEIIG